jgi:GT2 family glycosyltransferase
VTILSEPPKLSVSLVLYRPDIGKLQVTISSLEKAIAHGRHLNVVGTVCVSIIYNDVPVTGLIEETLLPLQRSDIETQSHQGHGNIGFGRAHNLAIRKLESDYHLVLNPDVDLALDSLSEGLGYLRSHKEAALAAPRLVGDDGAQQFGCKRFPSVFDFLLRGFAPTAIKRHFEQRLARYEMRDLADDMVTGDVPIVSGCFMLFRTSALQEINGFDERYFLYFEDFDISIRIRAYGLIAYLPMMQVIHHGGNSAQKGMRHILMFARSGLRFFHSHGWRLL